MRKAIGLVAGTWLGIAIAAPAAEPWSVGRPLGPFTLGDQHDRSHEVGPTLQLVLVSYDMDGGALVRGALDGAPADALASRGAAYIANVSRMPALVTRLFALPRLRKRPYPVLLDRDGTATAALVGEEGRAVAVRVTGGTITSVETLQSAAAVKRLLGLPEPPPPAGD